jgi:hypothetical protein
MNNKKCNGYLISTTGKGIVKCRANLTNEDNIYCDTHMYFSELSQDNITKAINNDPSVTWCGKCRILLFDKTRKCKPCAIYDSTIQKEIKNKKPRCQGFESGTIKGYRKVNRDELTRCKHHPVQDSLYCNFHSYMKDYDEYKLNNLSQCSGCHKIIYIHGTYHTCLEFCRSRKKKSDKKEPGCIYENCKFKQSKDSEFKEYCGKHQTEAWKISIEEQDKKVCTNYKRGCRTILEIYDKYSRCNSCRIKERNLDKEKKEKSNNHNIITSSNNNESQINNSNEKNINPFGNNNELQINNSDEKNINPSSSNNNELQINNSNEKNINSSSNNNELQINNSNEKNINSILNTQINNRIMTEGENIDIELICSKCNKKYNYTKFQNNKGQYGNKCIYCLNIQRLYDEKREARNERITITDAIREIRRSANRKGLAMELTDDEITNIISHNCTYCNKNNEKFNGIDRLDSNNGYIIGNVTSCCSMCNMMKQQIMPDDFIRYCYNIKNNYKCNEEFPNFEKIKYTPYTQIYYTNNTTRGIKFNIPKEEYMEIIKKKCYYCANTNIKNQIGVDRIDSNIEYKTDNIVSCCKICNFMKRQYTIDNFYNKICEIVEYDTNKNISSKIGKIPRNIKKKWLKQKYIEYMNKLELDIEQEKDKEKEKPNIDNRGNHVFKFSNKYYEDKMYNTYDITNFHAELEFCETEYQHDIWMYYRLKISSFEFNKPYGRLIRILIKDKSSGKYVGIASLSSDVLNLKVRDEFLNLTIENKIIDKKLNNIMNISTCVGIPPFSFNYNGGKLIAMLMFSNEVYNYCKNKYNEELIGFITLSLYGKSIQYDQLKELELIGYSSGHGANHIPKHLYDISNKYIIQQNLRCINYKSRLHKINYLLSHLELNRNITKHGINRGIYFGYLGNNAKDFIQNKTKEFIPDFCKSVDDISHYWKERWAKKRFKHLISTGRVMINYSFDNNIINNKDMVRNRVNKFRKLNSKVNNVISDDIKRDLISRFNNNTHKPYTNTIKYINEKYNITISSIQIKKILLL